MIGPALADLNDVNFTDLVESSFPLGTPTWTYSQGVLTLSYPFNSTLQDQAGSITINPSMNSKFFASSPTTIAFTMVPTNNLPAVYYQNETYQEVKKMDYAFKGSVYASYGVLTIGLFVDKVVGVELFGVLQFAYISVSNLNYVQPLLSPLMNFSMVNGYNPQIVSSDPSKLPNRIRSIGYTVDFLNNINAMLGMFLAWIFLSGTLYLIGSFVEKLRERLQSAAKHMLKQYLLTMIVFNSFNVAYSLGLQLKYNMGDSSVLNLVACSLALATFVAIILAMYLTDAKEYGEFLSHYRNNLMSKSYFPITIIYRFLLGASSAGLNEYEEMTVVNLFIGVIFTVYLWANLPYRKGYHNYRALVIQITFLVVLSVTMYYRSMKSNASPDAVFHVLTPALLEVIMIFCCIGLSMGCLAYEIYLKASECVSKK